MYRRQLIRVTWISLLLRSDSQSMIALVEIIMCGSPTEFRLYKGYPAYRYYNMQFPNNNLFLESAGRHLTNSSISDFLIISQPSSLFVCFIFVSRFCYLNVILRCCLNCSAIIGSHSAPIHSIQHARTRPRARARTHTVQNTNLMNGKLWYHVVWRKTSSLITTSGMATWEH